MAELAGQGGASFRRRLTLVVAVGAITRLMLWAAKWNRTLMLNDSLYYSAQAADLTKGKWYAEPFTSFQGAEHPPLTSTLMAAVSFGHDPVRWQRLVTVACGIATIALIGVLARSLAGPTVGLVAAGLAVVYPNLWVNDGLIMSESVSVLTVVLALLLLLRTMQRPSWQRAAWCGVGVGLATLARSELVLLIPFAVVFLLWRAWRRWRVALVMSAVAVAVLAPWVGYNLSRFERPVFLTTNDGTTLAGSYCDEAYAGPEIGGWSILCVQLEQQALEPSVRSALRRDQGIDYLRAHVGDTPKVVVARVARTLDLYGLDNLVAQDVGEERWRWASWAGIVSFWILAPLAVYGLVRLRPQARWLLLGPVIAVALATVLFYGAHRIRSSAEPTVVIAAAVALVAIGERVAARRRAVPRPVPEPV